MKCISPKPSLALILLLVASAHAATLSVSATATPEAFPLATQDSTAQVVIDSADAKVVQTGGQELKLVWPQTGVDPQAFASLDFERFYLQPMDGPNRDANTQVCVAYCLSHPQWRLSVQTHKYLGLP